MNKKLLLISCCASFAFSQCGVILPLKIPSLLEFELPPISSTNTATAFCGLGVINLVNSSFSAPELRATKVAIGLDNPKNILTGSSFDFGVIFSEKSKAYGLKYNNSLLLSLNASLFIIPSWVKIAEINAQTQAYGIYAGQKARIRGGDVLIGNIISRADNALGIKANTLEIKNSKVEFGNLSALNRSGGVDVEQMILDDATLKFGKIQSAQDAFGLYFGGSSGNLAMRRAGLSFGEISSIQGSAFGLYFSSGGINYDDGRGSYKTPNTLTFHSLSGVKHAIGIASLGGGRYDLSGRKFDVLFESIKAQEGNAIGLYSTGSSSWEFQNDAMIFNQITSQSANAYGVYSEGKLDLSLENSLMSFRMPDKQKHQIFAFSQGGSIDIVLNNSTLLLDGNGGEISYLNAFGESRIDLSGKSFDGFAHRLRSRKLSIKKIVSIGSRLNDNLTFALYENPAMGINDSVEIASSFDSHKITLEIYLDTKKQAPSASPTESSPKERSSQYATPSTHNRYMLVGKFDQDLLVNQIALSQTQGVSIIREGMIEVETTLYRHNQGGSSYYYIDTEQKQKKTLIPQIKYYWQQAFDLGVGSLFLTSDMLSKRMGDLRRTNERGGLWGRVSFGGFKAQNEQLQMNTLELGGDFGFTRGNAQYFLGIGGGYSPMIGVFDGIENAENFDFGVYGGVAFDAGLYYFAQIKGSYLQATISQNAFLHSAQTSHWGVEMIHELGYRLDFGEKGGFYLQPSALLGIGGISASDYKQVVKGTQTPQTLYTKLSPAIILDSKIGGSMGYYFGEEGRGFDLLFGVFYHIRGVWSNSNQLKLSKVEENITETFKSNHIAQSASFKLGSNIFIANHSKLYLDLDFGVGSEFFDTYKVNASYKFVF